LERSQPALAAQVSPMGTGDTLKVVYVERPAGTADTDRLSFDTFRGGGDLRVGTATFAAAQRLNAVDDTGSASLLTGCPGLTGGADVQTPDVANDGNRVVFAARAMATQPLSVFITTIDGSAPCVQVTPALPDTPAGLKFHNFSPVFSPDGKWIVFAST